MGRKQFEKYKIKIISTKDISLERVILRILVPMKGLKQSNINCNQNKEGNMNIKHKLCRHDGFSDRRNYLQYQVW